VKHVLVKSLAGGTCRIVNLWPGRDYVFYPVQVRDLENQKTVDSKIKGYQIEFKTKPGHTYVVERPEKPLESFSETILMTPEMQRLGLGKFHVWKG